MEILVENVSKNFGSFKALDNINLEIRKGSLVSLLGSSGSENQLYCGRSPSLEPPDSGKIWISGEDATYKSIQERNIGFVFCALRSV